MCCLKVTLILSFVSIPGNWQMTASGFSFTYQTIISGSDIVHKKQLETLYAQLAKKYFG
jgi:hypothetical protein